MKIAIAGSTGFIGKQLTNYLLQRGHEVTVISRNDFSGTDNELAKIVNSVEVILNLAGSPVLCRWNRRNKHQILSSRVETTRSLVEAVQENGPDDTPKVFINASAIGIYIDSGIQDESSETFGSDFSASVCKAWERETAGLNGLTIRTCIVRTGIVLGTTGGSFKKMLPLFKAGIGGILGSGNQPFSFIHIHDYCRAIEFLIENSQCQGIYNLVSPEPVTNKYFTKIFAGSLHRPAFFSVPEFALKLIYGGSASMLTSGVSVLPAHLLQEGFKFEFPDISSTIADLVQKEGSKYDSNNE